MTRIALGSAVANCCYVKLSLSGRLSVRGSREKTQRVLLRIRTCSCSFRELGYFRLRVIDMDVHSGPNYNGLHASLQMGSEALNTTGRDQGFDIHLVVA